MNYELKNNIPQLRFSEFEGVSNYNKFIFDDIFLFSTGKNIKQKEASPDFDIPCVRYGELYHMYNEVITKIVNRTNLDQSELLFSNGDEILLPSAGEDPLDIGSASALTLSNVAIGRTINILRPKEDNIYSQIYVSYYINQQLRKKISTLAKGVSISNVYNSDLKKLTITLPNPTEQTKIAIFLTAVDKRINLLQKKKARLEQYKKGVMQKLFSQTLRFKKEDGADFEDWEEKKLGEVCEFTQGIQIPQSEQLRFFENGYVRYLYIRDFFSDNFQCFVKNIYPSKIISKNEIMVVNTGNTAGKVFTGQTGVLSNNSFKISFDNTIIDYNYLFLYLDSTIGQNRIRSFFNSGGQPHLGHKNISKVQLPLPILKEQKKIANFLSSIDKSIHNLQFTINNSQLFKKGLLQKMFV